MVPYLLRDVTAHQLLPRFVGREKRLEPRIICESKGTMAMDALAMKRMFEQAKAGRQQ